ncbi:hypothetical protein L1887_23544 [Cichorium endivia]|nr:hypothetical protein L1887_23544 [Cichorium endivia]
MAPLQRSTAPQADQLQIQHFIHQHPLNKLFMASEFNCDGCKTRGHGVRYRCSACDFDLHERCATSPHHLSSHIHPHHQLILLNQPGSSHFCDVCKEFTDGLRYTCQTCEFDVHIHCTQIPVATGVPKLTNLNGYQQQGGAPLVQSTAAFGGYHGVNHSQHAMVNHQQQQQGIPTAAFGNYQGAINGKPVMINHQHQQQMMPTTAFGGYGVNNNQAVMINHHQYQQQQGIPMTAFGGYHNQPVMIIQQQQQQQQQQQPAKSNTYSKVGKFAANVLMTSLIGVPINFNSKSR